MMKRLFHRPLIRVAAVILVLVAGAGLYWFQPWKLVSDQAVNETLAVVPAPPSAATPSAAAPEKSGSAAPARPAVVRQGEFISHEHDTSGLARVIRHPDGSYALELVGLDTSNGPDLRVWLSDQPVRAGTKGWRVFDDGDWAELGRLKGNKGDQSYAIPAGTDLTRLDSVAIWCKRFAVSFGAADLTPA
ncbi:MAG: DM13 domain-containing protein [Actinoplanes sp.]